MKGKVLEAMQAGVPVVTTPVDAEGIPEAISLFRIADSEMSFAKVIEELYNSESLYQSLVASYQAVIHQHFSEKAIHMFIEQNFLCRSAFM